MNLPVSGSMGVLIRAYKNGILSVLEIEQALVKIEKSGRYISKSLFESVLKIIHG